MPNRRLAAIMFTDIVGYTSLMAKDEKRAFQILHENRRIHKTLIHKYKGKFLKEMGDGILASFSSTTQAVMCASEIQRNAKSKEIPLKIGIHEGEVVFERGDVFGDGVNVASRIQEQAEANCIAISETVYKEIRNKSGIETEFIHEKKLKNVEEPLKIYKVDCITDDVGKFDKKTIRSSYKSGSSNIKWPAAVLILIIIITAGAYFIRFSGLMGVDPGVTKSIAVLPFNNLSNEKDNQYFCDGVMDAIQNHLAKVEDLTVVSRTSVEQFRENPPGAKEISRRLDVNYLVEGSVFRSGEKMQVNVMLIDARRDKHLWSDVYESELTDIFEVMRNIANRVARKVRANLSPEEKQWIIKGYTPEISTYDYYLQARENHFDYWVKNDREALGEAILLYQRSLDNDSSYAPAYTGLAMAYCGTGTTGIPTTRTHFWIRY